MAWTPAASMAPGIETTTSAARFSPAGAQLDHLAAELVAHDHRLVGHERLRCHRIGQVLGRQLIAQTELLGAVLEHVEIAAADSAGQHRVSAWPDWGTGSGGADGQRPVAHRSGSHGGRGYLGEGSHELRWRPCRAERTVLVDAHQHLGAGWSAGQLLERAEVDDGHAPGVRAVGLDGHVSQPPGEQVRMGEREDGAHVVDGSAGEAVVAGDVGGGEEAEELAQQRTEAVGKGLRSASRSGVVWSPCVMWRPAWMTRAPQPKTMAAASGSAQMLNSATGVGCPSGAAAHEGDAGDPVDQVGRPARREA